MGGTPKDEVNINGEDEIFTLKSSLAFRVRTSLRLRAGSQTGGTVSLLNTETDWDAGRPPLLRLPSTVGSSPNEPVDQ